MNFIVSAVTDVGLVKTTNQDSFNARVLNTACGKMVFMILCDGMGGLSKGEVASASLVNAFCKWIDSELPNYCCGEISASDICDAWCSIAVEYNEKIKAYGARSGVSLGTTLTAMLITETQYFIINVGDTRAYEIADGVMVLTKDQTLVAREVEEGLLSPEAAENDPRRSVLLQCVGASETVVPDFFYGETRLDAVYMLCSDGFRHEISKDEIFEYLRPDVMLNADGMKANMEALVDLNKQREERDNITVVSVRTF